jgi:hypothetical protein
VRKRRHGDKAVASKEFGPAEDDQYQANGERHAAQQATESVTCYFGQVTGDQCEQLGSERNVDATKNTQNRKLDTFQP